jgi:hypothetical protein
MPKRRVDELSGLRIELNEKERELAETAIYVNGFAKTAQGIGTAIGGLGLAGGLIIGAAVFKKELNEVVDWVKDKADLGKQEWLDENITQEKYNEHVNQRNDFWITEAKKQGRYGPAVGDMKHPEWSYAIEHMGKDALTFAEWEKEYAGEPAMTFDEWAVNQRNEEVRKRKGIIPILIRAIPGGEAW